MNLIVCRTCGVQNPPSKAYCTHCKHLIIPESPSSEISELKVEIAQLKQSFYKEVQRIEGRISALETQEKRTEEKRPLDPKPAPVTMKVPPPPMPPIEKKPSVFEEFIVSVLQLFLGYMSEFFKPLKTLYLKYKSENKLPIFFMTSAGIITFLSGFIFLFQYSFSTYFSEIGKVSVGFLTSGAFIFFGIRKYSQFADYSSALIALGISINYLTIYFLSTYFGITNASIGFILIGINSLIAFYMTLKFHTKVIAVLSLFGSVLAPFYLETHSGNQLMYYAYLLLIVLSSIYTGLKIRWNSYLYYILLLSYAVIEPSTLSNENTISYSIMYSVFMVVFSYTALFDGLHLKKNLEKMQIIILSVTVSVTTLNLYALNTNTNLLGIFYILQSLPFLVLCLRKEHIPNKKIHFTLLLIVSLFILLSIPCFIEPSLLGMMWSIEALLLLIFGFLFEIYNVRKTAYILLAIGALSMFATIPFLIIHWNLGLTQEPYLNLVFIGIIAFSVRKIMQRYIKNQVVPEHKLSKGLTEFIASWFGLVVVVSMLLVFGIYGLNTSVFLIFTLLFISEKFRLTVTKYVAFSFYLLLVIEIFISIIDSGSFRFSRQPLYGQLAVIEAFSTLWFLQFFYERTQVSDKFYQYATYARTAFYVLLPGIIFPATRAISISFLPLTLWVSVALSYVLYKRFKEPILKYEYYILLLVTSMWGIQLLISGDYMLGISSTFIALSVCIYFMNKARLKPDFLLFSDKPVLVFSYYYVGFWLLSATHVFFAFDISLFITSIYLNLLVYFKQRCIPVRPYFAQNYITSKFFFLFGLVVSDFSFQSILSALSVGLALIAIYGLFLHIQKPKSLFLGKPLSFKNRFTLYWKLDTHFFHLSFLILYTKLSFVVSFPSTEAYLTIMIILHAIYVLYETTKDRYEFLSRFAYVLFIASLIKLFMYDLKDFTLVTKISVFMLVGGVLLGSAYFFQRFKKE